MRLNPPVAVLTPKKATTKGKRRRKTKLPFFILVSYLHILPEVLLLLHKIKDSGKRDY